MDEFLKYAQEIDITINNEPADFYPVENGTKILVVEKDLGNYDNFNYTPQTLTITPIQFKNTILTQKGKF